jgi:phosphoglycolate phosphatase
MVRECISPKTGALIFDLDGTLIDSAESIKSSISVSFKRVGVVPKRPLNEIQIGPPLWELMNSLVGEKERHLLPSLIQTFIRHYDEVGYRSVRAYDGISNMLERLRDERWSLYIGTNKRIYPTRKILKLLNWHKFFKGVYSLDSFQPKLSNKSDLLRSVIDSSDLELDSTLYVGDRREDAEAAILNGIAGILVDWGYGEPHPEVGECSTVKNTRELLFNLETYSKSWL